MAPSFRAALTVACCLLAGCQTTYDLVGVTLSQPAGETRHFNGSYQGNIRQVRADGPGCSTEQGERVLMVGDGLVWYPYTPVTFFTSPISYDGKIEDRYGDTTMTGRIVGNHMDLKIASPNCETQVSMDYIFNHS